MSQYITRIDNELPRAGLGPILYKLDSAGRLRTWRMDIDREAYRTISGLADGKQAVSGWTTAVAKSKPTACEQARFEVLAQYDHQLNREYHLTADTVATAKMVEPMLAKTYDKFPGPGFAQPKLDGIRCIMNNDGAGMWSRQGQPLIAVPHLRAAANALFVEFPDLVLDGELYNHDLREDFGAISSIVRKKNPTAEQLELAEKVMQYHVYDIVDASKTFDQRRQELHRLIVDLDCPWIVLVPTTPCATAEQADAAYGQFVEQGYEGGMYRLDKPYEIGRRSKALLKRKEFITEEYPVVSIEEGKGNWAGAAKRMTLRLPSGATFGAGIRGSYSAGQALLAAGAPSNTAVATCRYFMLSPDGVPRFPVVVDYHPAGRVD